MKLSKSSTFQSAVQQISGLSFIYENLPIHSSLGRKKLMESLFCTDQCEIEETLDLTAQLIGLLKETQTKDRIGELSDYLSQFHDISHTLANLSAQKVLDDIQFFEIKKFAILTENVIEILQKTDISWAEFYEMKEVVALLDPEGRRIPHFYIYAEYSDEIARKRKQYSKEKNPDVKESLFLEISRLEDGVREKLSKQLSAFSTQLFVNFQQISALDLVLAKAKMAIRLDLCKPKIESGRSSLRGLFHPEVSSLLQSKSRRYQPVDLSFELSPLLITGANMSGKTILLKSVALAQAMLQFGLYVPAAHASMMLVDEVMLSIGERESEMSGLSSFAAEILTIDDIVKTVKKNVKVVALVDELARTTNPEEGKLIVKSFIEIMARYNTPAIVTTHYAGIDTCVRRLRVKGLQIDDNVEITAETINDYMDYSLAEITEDEVPEEALRIARILGVDEELTGNQKNSTFAGLKK
ncbi:DNA mismatch repair protein MutS [Bacteroidales bacterium OttesenSCG-928-B11]|nr:DNA mismatch repair protein MutS [Bacteroidales bacterium OttesenSCG-928-E04]MDL2308960.1 DNA mismatch repair protein MutS [Bacteroidales bacterium OttesenSCG-928-C03]MDL2312748.1 DNA mismatch repair protein MutS [Bacteroidales bacterium OttesenSCG-928-B11]